MVEMILFCKQHIPGYWEHYKDSFSIDRASFIIFSYFKEHIINGSYTEQTISMYQEIDPLAFLPKKEEFTFREKPSKHFYTFHYRYYDEILLFLPEELHKDFQEFLLYPFELLEKTNPESEQYQNILAHVQYFKTLLKQENI